MIIDLVARPAELAGLGGISTLDSGVTEPPAHAALQGLVLAALLQDAVAVAVLKVESGPHKCVGQRRCGGVTEFDEKQTSGGASKWGPSGFDDKITSEGILPTLVARAVDGSGQSVHSVQLRWSTVMRAEGDGVDMGEHQPGRIFMASDTDVGRGNVKDVCDHVLEDDCSLLGWDLPEDDGEGGEGAVPGGVVDSESCQWQVRWVIVADACGQLASEAVLDESGRCLSVGWGDVASGAVLEDESLRSRCYLGRAKLDFLTCWRAGQRG